MVVMVVVVVAVGVVVDRAAGDGVCCGLNVCICPSPIFIGLNLTSKVTVLGGGTFGKCLAHKGGALMNGISVFIKEPPESSSSPSAIEDKARSLQSATRKRAHWKPAMLAP